MVVPRGTTRNFRAGAAELPCGCRGTSARVPRNFRAGAAELPRGCCGTSAQAGADSARVDADLPCGRARIFRADSG